VTSDPGFPQRWYTILRRAADYWLQGHAFVFAAALAFFTVFSIAPVVIVAVAVAGLVLGEQAATGRTMSELEDAIGPQATDFVEVAVHNVQVDPSGPGATLLGLGLIVLGATTVFAQMQIALNAIWGVAPRPTRSGVLHQLLSRLLSLTVLLAIGFVLLVSMLLSIAVRVLISYGEPWLPVSDRLLVLTDFGLSLALVTLLFAAIFRILPDVVLSARDVLPGAFVAALLFAFGRYLIAYYLSHSAASSAYGAAGSLVMLLLWVNYSSLILLFGAAVTRADLEQRGKPIVPRRLAIRVQRTLIEG
jgi:membrane protein